MAWLTQSKSSWVMQDSYNTALQAEISSITKNSKANKQIAQKKAKGEPKAPARRKRTKLITLLQNEKKKVTG